jgi:hypothetical protein
MNEILAGACVVIAVLAASLLVLVLVRSREEFRRHQIQEGGDGPVNTQGGRDITSQRTCCSTLPGTAHRGTCKNSQMRSGDPNFDVND